MWDDDLLFEEYRIIRQRVERRLSDGRLVWAHAALFLMVVISAWMFFWNWVYFSYSTTLLAFGMAGWSLVLMGHGLWSWARSAAVTSRREREVERELRERYEQADTELLQDQRVLFRLRGLLDDDVRRRAGPLSWLALVLTFNAAVWAMWFVFGAGNSVAWFVAALLGGLLPPALAVNAWRRRGRDERLRRLLRGWERHGSAWRRSPGDVSAASARLSEDGELIDFYADDAPLEGEKLKRE